MSYQLPPGPGRPRSGVTPRMPLEQREIVHALQHAKEQIEWWKDERDDLVVQAYEAGVSVSRISRTAGMGPSFVNTIVHRRRKAESA